MSPKDAVAKPSQVGRTPLLWQGRSPDVWRPKLSLPLKLCDFCLSQKLLASAVHTLTCADQSWWNPGTLTRIFLNYTWDKNVKCQHLKQRFCQNWGLNENPLTCFISTLPLRFLCLRPLFTYYLVTDSHSVAVSSLELTL